MVLESSYKYVVLTTKKMYTGSLVNLPLAINFLRNGALKLMFMFPYTYTLVYHARAVCANCFAGKYGM